MMEYALGGELFVRIAESGSYSELEAKPIFAQIASAVQYMVSKMPRFISQWTYLRSAIGCIAESTNQNSIRFKKVCEKFFID